MSRRYGFVVALTGIACGLLTPLAQAQFFFEADAVLMDRSGSATGGPRIIGPDVIAELDSGFEPGYRLTLGGVLGTWQVDGSFTQVSSWQDSAFGTLNSRLILDGTAGNLIVDPGAQSNVIAFPNALFDASELVAAEQTESERLQPGAAWSYFDRANYRDFEVNFGTARNCRPWRISAGYRHIRYDGLNQFGVAGIFNALDTNDGAVFGFPNNDPNDALVADSFVAAGMTGFGGFDALATGNGPDTLRYTNRSRADNELNGAQTTLVWRMVDAPWITIEGIGKAGIFQNNMRAQVFESVIDGVGTVAFARSFTDTRVNAAFAGNIGMRAVFSLTDYMNLVTGYDIMFLNGIGVAGDQSYGLTRDLLGARLFQARNTGDVVLHGGNLGVEFNW